MEELDIVEIDGKKCMKLTTRNIANIIVSVKECWICARLLDEMYIAGGGTYLPIGEWWDDGVEEHVKQIINR